MDLYMTVKWGSTTCTVIKWGSTTCTAVYWGSTKVFPDEVNVPINTTTWAKWSGSATSCTWSITNGVFYCKITAGNAWYVNLTSSTIPSGKKVYLVCSNSTTVPTSIPGEWQLWSDRGMSYKQGSAQILKNTTTTITSTAVVKYLYIRPNFHSSDGGQRETYISRIYYV